MGVHLNEEGLTQAIKTAEWLSDYPITAIYSSPLSRAIETARPLVERMGSPLIENDDLTEIDFGDFVGKSFDELKHDENWLQRVINPAAMVFPNGETTSEVEARVKHFLNDLMSSENDDSVVVCYSHSDTIRILLAIAMGLSLSTYTRLSISPASISALSFWQQQWKIHFINLSPTQKFQFALGIK